MLGARYLAPTWSRMTSAFLLVNSLTASLKSGGGKVDHFRSAPSSFTRSILEGWGDDDPGVGRQRLAELIPAVLTPPPPPWMITVLLSFRPPIIKMLRKP